MNKIKIYNNLPVILQHILFNIEAYRIKKDRYSAFFWKSLAEYEIRDKWTYEKIKEYRDKKLREIIEHSYKTVPYYTNLFDSLGICYMDIKGLEDLKLLPVLKKETVIANYDQFLSRDYKIKDLVTSHTSGTTGSGFKFYTTKSSICEQWAVWWRYRRNLGINFNEWCANFGGKLIVPITQNKPPFWRVNNIGKQVYFSAFHQSDENLLYYFNEIEKRKIKWIHGFPSLISLLAAYMIENSLEFSYDIKHVTIGAENLLAQQKNMIEKAFKCKVYQHYGLAEGVSNFSQNKNGQIVVDEDFSATEFIETDGGFKIIGTTLTNYAMPLIRYDTNDMATISNQVVDKGRVVESIDGRCEDYIYLPNGIKVGRLDYAFKDTMNFKQVQLYQNRDFSIDVLVVLANSDRYDYKKDEFLSHQLLRDSLGKNIVIRYKYVDDIKQESMKKMKFVISEIK